ncbi:MAG: hypothetical protein MJ146_03670 [Clostridia bacterium]|nr:hypothetical protein [Clostridia bacterium]
MNKLGSMPHNYRNSVDWILGAYSNSGVTFANGFQKDAIQNCVGARKTHKYTNWSCDISLVENQHGTFVVVEDSGTVGLTGHNYSLQEIEDMMAAKQVLPPEERLARFSSMFNSGGNSTGGGLFGAGKSVYSVASQDYVYYFDSLREDGIYIANINNGGQLYETAFEGEDAKSFILKNTGLEEKSSVGTRIIIKNPKDELKDAITNGGIIDYIQESWWLIIDRLGPDSAITVNGIPVTVPSVIKDSARTFELQRAELFSTGYKVKHFGFYVFNNEDIPWTGLSYYRKGMKIGDIDIKDMPDKLKGKYWGYVEVDEIWEDALAEIEDNVHFGVSKGQKNKIAYQNLKNYCNEKVKANLIEWGYIKDKQSDDKKLKAALEQIADDLHSLFDKLGFEDLGRGPQKPDFDVRWQNVSFPVSDSETVTTGDSISFAFRIKSSYVTDKSFEYKLCVVDPISGSIISKIDSGKVTVKSNTFETLSFLHKIERTSSLQYSENRVLLSIKAIGSGKEKKKEFSYYYDCERPNNQKDVVTLNLHTCAMPQEGSRRVNYGESISNVSYRIENKRNHTLNYKLNVSIHNAEDPSCPKIEDICSQTASLGPFEETITPAIPLITFDESKYSKHLACGVIELRARLIAAQSDEQYDKGDKITFYHFKIYLNCDEKNGKADSFKIESVVAPERHLRSWCSPGNNRTISLNIGHPAYTSLEDSPESQCEYLKEQMMKQYILLYLKEGKYEIFSDGQEPFSALEPQEAVEAVIDKIENVYYNSLI